MSAFAGDGARHQHIHISNTVNTKGIVANAGEHLGRFDLLIVGLLHCCALFRLPLASLNSGFPTPLAPFSTLRATHLGCAARRLLPVILYVPSGHGPLAFFQDSVVPSAHLLAVRY